MNTISSAELMNRQYRFQRHIYDYTRTHYLFWRRRLIADLKPPRGGSIVEVACGTGWNLLRAAEAYPTSPLYGFDISREMLATSASSVSHQGLEGHVKLSEGDATNFDVNTMFGLHSADRIFISYALSMIPDWPTAVERGVAQLAPGGQLHIVDFGRMDKMHTVPRTTFLRFLAHYHVTPRRDLEAVLRATAQRHGLTCAFEEMRSGYAAYAVIGRDNT
jgi:S-adenosylmethionine-diacylgycerolhomoserine-N-methlytransferase